jgi:hypothetical protein
LLIPVSSFIPASAFKKGKAPMDLLVELPVERTKKKAHAGSLQLEPNKSRQADRQAERQAERQAASLQAWLSRSPVIAESPIDFTLSSPTPVIAETPIDLTLSSPTPIDLTLLSP